jgi:hypothetical protein
MSSQFWRCLICNDDGDTQESFTLHQLWHRMRRKPEHQTPEVRKTYFDRIPTDFGDRKNEAQHALEHGVLYYSRPALEAYLDYAETVKQREILNAPVPSGLSVEQIEGLKRDRDLSIRGILALGEARKMGATADRVIYPFLGHLYSMRSIMDITADFLEVKCRPEHPLEECPDPPK